MNRAHSFNPEHDYALASGRETFTPPAQIVTLRKSMALLPALWASQGDAILLADFFSDEEIADFKNRPEILEKGLILIKQGEKTDSDFIPSPWGWDHTVARRFLAAGIPAESLPSPEWIDSLRQLSHRSTAAEFCRLLNETPYGKQHHQPPAEEFHDAEEAIKWWINHPGAFFKAPWSSSGRGVLDSDSTTPDKVAQWIKGIIRRQGSVMAEERFDKQQDFATEWNVSENGADFAGFSLFHTDSRGHYLGNETFPSSELGRRIKEKAPGFSDELIFTQKSIINSLIAPHYHGPLGIDMMSNSAGEMRLCVEINLRMTMGHVTLLRQQQNK